MGFSEMKINPIAAQLNRGKLEQTVAFALSQVGMTLGKLANDCVWMLCQNTAFIAFPETLTTGSSIMPHKKNPDVFELVRAKANQLSAIPSEIGAISRNLISGYHRDFQLLKEPLFKAIDITHSIIDMIAFMTPQLIAQPIDFTEERYAGIFSVDQVANLVQQGVSFREAYVTVGKQVSSEIQTKPFSTTHIGSLNELGIDLIRLKIKRVNQFS
jgi:argininosuccinate lyase